MADDHHQLIGQRYALDYYRRPWQTRLWKSRWNWAALVLSILLLAVLYLWKRDQAFYAAPVSSAHAVFGTRCRDCHDRNWQTAVRLIALSDRHHSTSDAACRKCHNSADHSEGNTAAPGCAACHQEHRPARELVFAADRWCTQCHADLTAEVRGKFGPRYHASIVNFDEGPDGHPEFALLRRDAMNFQREIGLGPIAAFVPEGDGPTGTWRDRGGLKLNHQVHLAAGGVMDANRNKVVLQCADCHTPQLDGAYMAPIHYEQHCASCHPLRLGGRLAGLGTLPHEAPEAVRGVLRERLANLFDQLERTGQSAADRLPLLPRPVRLTERDARRVDAALTTADQAVFGPSAKGYCRYCHHVEAHDDAWIVRFSNPAMGLTAADEQSEEFARTAAMVPDRWLRHGGFHHEKHRGVQCAACHAAAESSRTTDILLPSIDVCRNCHGGRKAGKTAIVRADCVLCHKYHGEGGSFDGVPIEKLIAALARRPR